jgi:hypothetical protein
MSGFRFLACAALGLVVGLGVAIFADMTRLPSAERPPATIMARYSSSVMPVMLPAIC